MKVLVEDCQRLHISDVKGAIPKDAEYADICINENQKLHLIAKESNLGIGKRYYFLCPYCLKPYENLYKKDFGGYECRKCLDLIYNTCIDKM
ncbi:MAG: hypothetical protein KAS32_03815 [Candidatus Peribacteraceae bacterium]|nr:hypothetical protein [Candidatus Peribacteraceae bacterium]